MLSFSRPALDLSRPRRHNADWFGGSIAPRPGYRLDQASAVIGTGAEAFERATAAMRRWDMAKQSWTSVRPDEPTLEPGTQIAVVARVWPLWSASVGMITTVDETPTRFSFSYATTGDHVAIGEEEFAVELVEGGDVVFTIRAVSRPSKWWAWVGYPMLRLGQARFRRGAVAAMRRAANP